MPASSASVSEKPEISPFMPPSCFFSRRMQIQYTATAAIGAKPTLPQSSVNDTAWFEKIDASGGAVFFASGVFYYFLKEQVRILVRAMADAFQGGVLVFDAANEKAVKLMQKTWLKDAEIKDVGAYFAVSDAKSEIDAWDSSLWVSSRGYMLGYHNLKDPSVSGLFRFLARVGDGMMNMQIVKIGFGGKRWSTCTLMWRPPASTARIGRAQAGRIVR